MAEEHELTVESVGPLKTGRMKVPLRFEKDWKDPLQEAYDYILLIEVKRDGVVLSEDAYQMNTYESEQD